MTATDKMVAELLPLELDPDASEWVTVSALNRLNLTELRKLNKALLVLHGVEPLVVLLPYPKFLEMQRQLHTFGLSGEELS